MPFYKVLVKKNFQLLLCSSLVLGCLQIDTLGMEPEEPSPRTPRISLDQTTNANKRSADETSDDKHLNPLLSKAEKDLRHIILKFKEKEESSEKTPEKSGILHGVVRAGRWFGDKVRHTEGNFGVKLGFLNLELSYKDLGNGIRASFAYAGGGATPTYARTIVDYWKDLGAPQKISIANVCVGTACALYLSIDNPKEVGSTYLHVINTWNDSSRNMALDEKVIVLQKDSISYFCHGIAKGILLSEQGENLTNKEDVISFANMIKNGAALTDEEIQTIFQDEQKIYLLHQKKELKRTNDDMDTSKKDMDTSEKCDKEETKEGPETKKQKTKPTAETEKK